MAVYVQYSSLFNPQLNSCPCNSSTINHTLYIITSVFHKGCLEIITYCIGKLLFKKTRKTKSILRYKIQPPSVIIYGDTFSFVVFFPLFATVLCWTLCEVVIFPSFPPCILNKINILKQNRPEISCLINNQV